MIKKILLTFFAVLLAVGTAATMSAFEAHIINVTARLENALKVVPVTDELDFGTMFPQEYQQRAVWLTTSESFCETNQRRVLNIDYKIVQKPKPIWEQTAECLVSAGKQFEDIEEARFYCHQNPSNLDCCYPSLCPYLSKTPTDNDPAPYTDYGVPAFHDPTATSSIATGTINKDYDQVDEWLIDLASPCFETRCSQDWPDFVHSYNPSANPEDYKVPPELESSIFGCDLWFEVTNIY